MVFHIFPELRMFELFKITEMAYARDPKRYIER